MSSPFLKVVEAFAAVSKDVFLCIAMSLQYTNNRQLAYPSIDKDVDEAARIGLDGSTCLLYAKIKCYIYIH